MKKMCPNAIKASYGWGCSTGGKCPEDSVYVNDRSRPCRIVEHHVVTKKPKVVKIKAWAFKADGTGCDSAGWHCVPEQYYGTIPVTILIDAKWLKEKK